MVLLNILQEVMLPSLEMGDSIRQDTPPDTATTSLWTM